MAGLSIHRSEYHSVFYQDQSVVNVLCEKSLQKKVNIIIHYVQHRSTHSIYPHRK